MDGRARSAQIEQKKETLIEACKAFFTASQQPITAVQSGHLIEAILFQTEELMRAQGEIP